MPLPTPLISLSGAGVKAGEKWLVRGVTLDIHPGKIVTLIGPNGSGKSTTAKMALGIKKPSEGRAHRSQNLRVGYVPQKLNIDWTVPLTVSRFMNLTGKISNTAAHEALESAGVLELLNAEMVHLSGGEFQRVLIARAIAKKPNLLVLDEPVQGVDFSGESALYELISSVRDQLNCGVLMISHDLHMVMASTDHVVCLNGHMCCSGTPTAVQENEDYLKIFGSRAASGLAVYQHHHDHTHLPDGRVQHSDGSITDHCHPDDGHHHGSSDKAHNHA